LKNELSPFGVKPRFSYVSGQIDDQKNHGRTSGQADRDKNKRRRKRLHVGFVAVQGKTLCAGTDLWLFGPALGSEG
jgi:hypothetical protein